jgi:hypothetical protein
MDLIFMGILAIAAGTLVLLWGAGNLLPVLFHRRLPTGPRVLDRLDALDSARLDEALHLKQVLGESVWTGWGQTEIPIVLWNHEFSFLTGVNSAPAGWETVPDDTFNKQVYYRQPTYDRQNFAVQLNGKQVFWAASMATKWETDAFLIKMFHQMLPTPLDKIFPYRLVIQPSEVQISGVLHESFHVYQVQVVPTRLDAAEKAHHLGDSYYIADRDMQKDWRSEIERLARALKATSNAHAIDQARQFLICREVRRQTHHLDLTLVDYERQIEWEEGCAKYIELAMWRAAATSQSYEPVPAMASDPDFKHYNTFRQRWSQEVNQLRRQASRKGETRFYYTGMAQAMLLDKLLPEWKERIWSTDTWLETLLEEATR